MLWHYIRISYFYQIQKGINYYMPKSTIMTAVAVANSMVGSSIIIFPLNFNNYGILVNVFFVILMAFLMSLTCKLLYDHLLISQIDISQSITRKLGPIFGKAFGVISSVTLFLVASIYFLLAIDIFYDVLIDIFGPIDFPQKIFKLILEVFFGGLIFLKNLDWVFKASPFAMGALIISTITLIISIGFNTQNIDSSFLDFKQLSLTDILAVASINGFAFITHPSLSPIVKEHQHQKQNWKAIFIGYGFTTIIYLMVGILGALSIFGRHPEKHSNIIDYYSGSFQSPLIGFLVFLYLVSIFPIFPFVSKNQFIQLIPKQKRQNISHINFKASIIFAVVWIPMNALFIIFDTSPLIVIQFLSTVMCYYLTYFLPVVMTLKRGQYQKVNEEHEQSLIIPDIADGDKNEDKKQQQTAQDEKVVDKEIPLWEKGLYSIVIIIGTVIFVSDLILMFV